MSKVQIPLKTLNNGYKLPMIGLGTWAGLTDDGKVDPVEMVKIKEVLAKALEVGYRHIDTASLYRVEPQIGEAVSEAIQKGLVKREDLYIVTKLWNDKHKPEDVESALRASLSKLKMDYVDLYLVHWPVAFDITGKVENVDYLDTWKAMESLVEKGLTKSIGVSNFNVDQMKRLLSNCKIRPAMNQVELNLNLQQVDLVEYCTKENVGLTAYTPFGSIVGAQAQRPPHDLLKEGTIPTKADDPQLVAIAKKYNKTVSQILLKHLVQQGIIPIPKTATPSRLVENASIFDFELSSDDLSKLRTFNNGYRTIVPLPFQDSPHYPFKKSDVKIDVFPKDLLTADF